MGEGQARSRCAYRWQPVWKAGRCVSVNESCASCEYVTVVHVVRSPRHRRPRIRKITGDKRMPCAGIDSASTPAACQQWWRAIHAACACGCTTEAVSQANAGVR
ncbi:hypothetical protein xavtCFBP7764_10615 [Xanthomonas citri]|nr:hypothetical protein xavtCFBP7764_10615 [Xanthomonas citri]